MHPEAYRAVAYMARELNLTRAATAWRLSGLDIGGTDVNGSARGLLSAVRTWAGLDIEPGPGVQYVADATDSHAMMPHQGGYDVVLCTEVLEHVEDWPAIVRNAAKCLRSGGHLVLTCAGRGRTPHGARGAKRPAEGEHYANVEWSVLELEMGKAFSQWSTRYNPKPGDLYAWGRV